LFLSNESMRPVGKLIRATVSAIGITFCRLLDRGAAWSRGVRTMKKSNVLGLCIVSAVLCAAPFSLQWSAMKLPSVSLDSAEARIGRPLTPFSVAGVHRRMYRRAYYGAGAYGYGRYGYRGFSYGRYGSGYGGVYGYGDYGSPGYGYDGGYGYSNYGYPAYGYGLGYGSYGYAGYGYANYNYGYPAYSVGIPVLVAPVLGYPSVYYGYSGCGC